MSTSSSSSKPPTKYIRLLVPHEYHCLGYQDYAGHHVLSDTPAFLKSPDSETGRLGGITLLFRGQRISPEEENMTFEELMKKYNVSMDEDTLVFHTMIHPDVVLARRTAYEKARQELQDRQLSDNRGSDEPLIVPALNPPTSPQHVNSQPVNTDPTTTTQPPPIAPLNAAEAGPSTQPAQANVPVAIQDAAATHPAIQEAITQLTHNPPIRPNIQLLPVQYQGVLINGLPYLTQLQRPQIRLSSDTVIPVTTHSGQPALIVSPAGVASLAQQGYRVEVRVFNQNQQQRNAAQPQIPPPERRFGLADFVSLFRRRLGQQLWLMCKLAFMVGIFSSNNASWRRIVGLVIAAAGIFFWQTGELERWFRRFRRPMLQVPAPATGLVPPQAAAATATPAENARPQAGPMAAVTAGLRLAEQILFVFVASLWPNAVGGGDANPPDVMRVVNPPAQQQRDEANDDPEEDDDPENNGVFQDPAAERQNVVVQ